MATVESFSSVSAVIVSFSRIWIQVRNQGWKDNLWERQCLLLPILLLSAQAFIMFLLPNSTEQVTLWKMHPQVSPLQSFIAAPRHFSGQIWDACYLPTGKVRLRRLRNVPTGTRYWSQDSFRLQSLFWEHLHTTEIESTTYLLPKYETKAYP